MCFAPQRRALFRHRFQKWSDTEVFYTFWLWLRNVLRATTACTFSTSQLPKVVRRWCVLCILTSKCASRHNGVQFFISHLASWLRTRRFSEPTFRPSGATNHWKNTVFRDFPTFSRICIFFLLTLSLLLFSLLIVLFSLPLPYSAFHLSILSEVWLQKLPSTILYNLMFIKTRKALNALHLSSHYEAAFQVAFKSANGQKDWVKASCFPRYFPTACFFSRPFFTCDVCFLVWFIGLTLYTYCMCACQTTVLLQ